MLTCGTPWPHTNSAPDGDQSMLPTARRRTDTSTRTVCMRSPRRAKCTDSSREECTTDHHSSFRASPWCPISPAMASGVTNVSPGLRFDDAWKRPASRFIQLGCAASDLKRRRRHGALTSHGISPAARRARANAEARGGAPGGSDGRPAPGRWQSAHLFGQIPGSGAARSAGGPAQDALTWRCG